MPKFETKTSLPLSETLKAMGVIRPFEKLTAEFDPMIEILPGFNVYIMDVLQKTYIKVNEEGSEAAAVTGVIMGAPTASRPIEPKEFIADRPFVYFIRDDKTEQILFIGEYAFAK